MTAELGGWLAELGESEPATAAIVAGSLVAVLESADPSVLAIIDRPSALRSDDPRETADRAYQQLLEDLQQVRRSAADVASTRHRAELQLGLHRESGADATEIAIVEAQLADAQRREEDLATRSQRLQDQVDAYRTATESAKAMYTASEAQLHVAEALDTDGGDRDAELAKLREEARASAARLLKLAGQTASPPDGAAAAPGLLELRADPAGIRHPDPAGDRAPRYRDAAGGAGGGRSGQRARLRGGQPRQRPAGRDPRWRLASRPGLRRIRRCRRVPGQVLPAEHGRAVKR